MSRNLDEAKGEAWRKRLRRFDRGLATVADFCEGEGVSVASFYQWRQKLAAVDADSLSVDRPGFVAVEITPPSPGDGSSVQVFFPGGARMLVPCQARDAISAVVAAVMSDAREVEAC
jgi:hypothetical protein